MQSLVFDIETVPLPFDESFDDVQKEYLLRSCKTEEEIENQKRFGALNPLLGQVVWGEVGDNPPLGLAELAHHVFRHVRPFPSFELRLPLLGRRHFFDVGQNPGEGQSRADRHGRAE